MRYEGRRIKDEGRKNAGFTLVELIIVVIVIGILAAVGMPQYTKAIEKARGAEASAGLNNIQQGEKIYFANNEKYLITAADTLSSSEQSSLDVSLPQTGWKFQVSDTSSGKALSYNITATRKAGACSGKTTIQDNKGNLIDNGSSSTDGKSEWEECQGNL